MWMGSSMCDLDPALENTHYSLHEKGAKSGNNNCQHNCTICQAMQFLYIFVWYNFDWNVEFHRMMFFASISFRIQTSYSLNFYRSVSHRLKRYQMDLTAVIQLTYNSTFLKYSFLTVHKMALKVSSESSATANAVWYFFTKIKVQTLLLCVSSIVFRGEFLNKLTFLKLCM